MRLASITPSLTMLVAVCQWDEYWGDALERIVRTDYETAWVPIRGGHQIYGPSDRKELEIKHRREEMHRRLASWLTEQVPGAFEDLGAPHPGVDIISTALAEPFRDNRFDPYDYRQVLSIARARWTAVSPDLPGWILAGPEPDGAPVLVLAGRTADVFDDRLLADYGGASREALGHYLTLRMQDLVGSWATLCLLEVMRRSLASTRDRAPEVEESSARFTKRLSGQVATVLRRGADLGAFCADVRRHPAELGPFLALRLINFTVRSWFGGQAESLAAWWSRRVTDEVARVAELEQEQRGRLSTSVELAGLGLNVRTQRQMVWLTIALVAFAIFTIALGVIQLSSGGHTEVRTVVAHPSR